MLSYCRDVCISIYVFGYCKKKMLDYFVIDFFYLLYNYDFDYCNY